MKKSISAALSLCLAMSLITPAAAASTESLENFKITDTYTENFTDVTAQSWFHDPVKSCYELELMKGVAPNAFDPMGNLTVAQALVMACRVDELYSTGLSTLTNGTPWYQPYVDYALEHFMIFEDEFDSYTRPITREEMVNLFYIAVNAREYDQINHISKVPDTEFGSSSVLTFYRAGILTGDATGAFHPQDNITRAEAAAIISRIVLPDQRKTFTLPGQTVTPLLTPPSAEKNGLTLTVKDIYPDDFWGATLILSVENHTGHDITLEPAPWSFRADEGGETFTYSQPPVLSFFADTSLPDNTSGFILIEDLSPMQAPLSTLQDLSLNFMVFDSQTYPLLLQGESSEPLFDLSLPVDFAPTEPETAGRALYTFTPGQITTYKTPGFDQDDPALIPQPFMMQFAADDTPLGSMTDDGGYILSYEIRDNGVPGAEMPGRYMNISGARINGKALDLDDDELFFSSIFLTPNGIAQNTLYLPAEVLTDMGLTPETMDTLELDVELFRHTSMYSMFSQPYATATYSLPLR